MPVWGTASVGELAMNDLEQAIRTGTAEEIAEAIYDLESSEGCWTQADEIAEAIVAARPKPEDVVPGTVDTVDTFHGRIIISHCDCRGHHRGDRVTITKDHDNG